MANSSHQNKLKECCESDGNEIIKNYRPILLQLLFTNIVRICTILTNAVCNSTGKS